MSWRDREWSCWPAWGSTRRVPIPGAPQLPASNPEEKEYFLYWLELFSIYKFNKTDKLFINIVILCIQNKPLIWWIPFRWRCWTLLGRWGETTALGPQAVRVWVHFKVILTYTVSFRTAWPTRGLCLKNQGAQLTKLLWKICIWFRKHWLVHLFSHGNCPDFLTWNTLTVTTSIHAQHLLRHTFESWHVWHI